MSTLPGGFDDRTQVIEDLAPDVLLPAVQEEERNDRNYHLDINRETLNAPGSSKKMSTQAAVNRRSVQIKQQSNCSWAPGLPQNQRHALIVYSIGNPRPSLISKPVGKVLLLALMVTIDVVLFFGSFKPTDWFNITRELVSSPFTQDYQPPDWGVYKYFLYR